MKTIFAVPLLMLACVAGFAQSPKIYSGAQAATRVIGQPDYTTDLPGEQAYNLGSPTNMALAGTRLIVADGGLDFTAPQNNRVLIYNNYLTAGPNTSADVVLGQPAFGDVCLAYQAAAGTPSTFPCTNPAAGANGMNLPIGVSTDGVRLVVADSLNNRVLIFNTIPTTNGANADIVVGQPDFNTTTPNTTQTGLRLPNGVLLAFGKLFVADTQNNRIMVWNTIPTTNNAPADFEIGQSNFTSRNIPATPSANDMQTPVSVTTDGTHLLVTDLGNNRIMIYDHIPTANVAADVEIGQTDFTGSVADTGSYNLDFPRDAWSDGQRLLVSDSGNNRILVYNTFPTLSGAFPDAIIGQYDTIGHLEGLSVEKLANPMGLLPLPGGQGFLVADVNNRRVVEFDAGFPLVSKSSIGDAAAFNGDGLQAPVNVQAAVAANTSAGTLFPGGNGATGNFYVKVTALNNTFPREGLPSAELLVNVPSDIGTNQIVISWDPVPLATNYRVYFGRVTNLEDRYQAADLEQATATPLVIGGTPSPGDVITIIITDDDLSTWTYTYTVSSGQTVGNLSDAIASGLNTDTSNPTNGVTATSNHQGTITWQAKDTGSIGNNCQYNADVTFGTGTTVSPTGVVQFTGATDGTSNPTATVTGYPPDPTLAGTFGNQRPYDNLVPGEIVVIYGSDLADSAVTATQVPLPYTLANTQVLANGVAVPLVSVSPTQIQFQMPMEITGTSVGIQVVRNLGSGGTISTIAMPMTLTNPQPAMYTADGTGIGGALVLHADGTLVTSLSPASLGEQVTFFGTGFGLMADYPQNTSFSLDTNNGQLIPGTYFLRVTTIYPDGSESYGSTENIIDVSFGDTNEILGTWNAVPGAQKYRVYTGSESLNYDRYYETDTNSIYIATLYGTAGKPPAQTNVPGNGVLGVGTTIAAQLQGNSCPILVSGPNPGVVGVWRITCTIPTTLSPSDLFMQADDLYGAGQFNAVVGAIDSNHVFIPILRPQPISFALIPPALTFNGVAGGANPATQQLVLSKSGGGTLTWLAVISTTDGGSWLTADSTTGMNSGVMNVSIDMSQLTVGVWTGTFTVTGSDDTGALVVDSNGNPLSVTATVTVNVSATSVAPTRRSKK